MPYLNKGESQLDRIVQSIRELWEGRSHAVGQVTLAAGAATTSVDATNCSPDSKIWLTPRTATAATEFGAGTWYISSVVQGGFVITHVNSGVTTRTFDWGIQG